MNLSGKRYPRAWPADDPPLRTLFGFDDLKEVVPSVAASTIRRWLDNGHLPAADGPDVNGAVTWTRNMVLVWIYTRNLTPVHLLAETQALLSSPDGQKLLDTCVLGALLRHV